MNIVRKWKREKEGERGITTETETQADTHLETHRDRDRMRPI